MIDIDDLEQDNNPSAEMIELHEEALRGFNASYTLYKDVRLQCLQDRRFNSISGAQWEGALKEQYQNKPKYELNKINTSLMRLYEEYKRNNIGVRFVTKDGGEDEETDTAAKLYRADESDSDAEEALDNAFLEASSGGFGAYRVYECYEDQLDDENERQIIKWAPIFDADTLVYFDADAKKLDKSDAKRCWVLVPVTKDRYREVSGEEPPPTMPRESDGEQFDWFTPDVVYLAEYYVVEEVPHTVHIYKTVTGREERYTDDELTADPDIVKMLKATGGKKVRTKKTERRRVHKYIISGAGVLEDCGYIAGSEIPIIPVYGKREVIDNVERCAGHGRLAKDAQRLFNMMVSKLAEISASSSIEKPIFTAEQMAGHAGMWADDPVKNYPYLLINAVTGTDGSSIPTGPVGTLTPPSVPQTMAALIQLVGTDIKELLGSSTDADKMVSNISEDAVGMIQQRLDTLSGIYLSNFAKAVKRGAQVWLSKARELYVEKGRKMRGIAADDSSEQIELMLPSIDKSGKPINKNDLTKAAFDITVDIGPRSSSQRQAITRSLLQILPLATDPETQNIIMSSIIMNLEGEGLTSLRDYFRKRLVAVGAVDPSEEEKQQMEAAQAAQGPDPQALYLQAASEEAQANAAKKRVDTIKTVAETEKVRAETAETLAGIDQADREQLLSAAQLLAKSAPKAPDTATAPPQVGEQPNQ